MSPFPIERVRERFPSLALSDDGRRRIYLDNPAGTQVPATVAQAAHEALVQRNANLGGFFRTSREAEETVMRAHEAMAVFLNAASYREIVIGPSTTTLTFHVAQSLARELRSGDEIVVTRMDHDANVAPWLMMAEDFDLHVRWLDFDPDSWVLEPAALHALLSERTRLVALNYASNLTGSVNDVAQLTRIAKSAGARVIVDAVQFAPHGLIDVQAIGCDFLTCSSYKFFGPHLGILWAREALLESLVAYKVRPQTSDLPWKWETGTPQIELQAALTAAVEYLQWLGEACGGATTDRHKVVAAYAAIHAWEDALTRRLTESLVARHDLRICGITDAADFSRRGPIVSFTHRERPARDIARALAAQNVFVWSGNNFALEVVRALGIDEDDGVVRMGAVHYNTPEEVDAAVRALENVLR